MIATGVPISIKLATGSLRLIRLIKTSTKYEPKLVTDRRLMFTPCSPSKIKIVANPWPIKPIVMSPKLALS